MQRAGLPRPLLASRRMRFSSLALTSRDVARASGRNDKIDRLARVLREVATDAPDDVEAAVAMLSGAPRQGSIGIGHAALAFAADVPPADDGRLTLHEVDNALTALAGISGAGSGRERAQQLRQLFSQATRDEQDFLRRLLSGELRQGALEGVLVEAVAKAANVPADRLRRSTMLAGGLLEAARVALVK